MDRSVVRRAVRLLFPFACFLGLLFAAAGVASAATRVIYVKAGAPAGGNGQSWATAYGQVSQAITDAKLAPPGDGDAIDIWVTAGTFTPDIFSTSGDLINAATFDLRSWVHIRGGFAGTESSPAERSAATPATILSGDIQDPYSQIAPPTSRSAAATAALPDPTLANFQDNVRNVIRCVNAVGAELDRLVITGGYARNDASYPDAEIEKMGLPDPTNLTTSGAIRALVPNIAGGGIYVENTAASTGVANLTLTDCIVTQNYARGFGAGIAAVRAKVQATSTLFVANYAVRDGGGYFGRDQAVNFFNCDFIGNKSQLSGGGVFLESPVRVPAGWSDDPRAALLDSKPTEYQNLVGNAIQVARLGSVFNQDRFRDEIAPSVIAQGLDQLNGANSTLANPSAGVSIANRVEGPTGYVTAGITVLAGGVALAHELGGANDDFTMFVVNDFIPNFNRYTTPTGLSTVLAGQIIKAAGLDYPDVGLTKNTYGSLYNLALAQQFTNCRFTGNFAAYDGAGLEAIRDNLQLDQCIFADNRARHDGALTMSGFNQLRATNSVFSANAADGVSAAMLNIFVRARFSNCTLVNNISDSLGGYAIGVGSGAECRVVNSILWGNTDPAANHELGGADIFTARYANLSAATRDLYNRSPSTPFAYVGLTEIANCDIQGLSELVNNWDVSGVQLFTEHRTYFPDEIAALLFDRDQAEAESAHDEWGLVVVGEGDRISDRQNFSADPLLHDSWLPGFGSPILSGGSLARYHSILSPANFTDLYGNDRWFRDTIGLGAVADPSLPTGSGGEVVGRYFIRTTATGDGSGRNWANASSDLKGKMALPNAEVWVAAGTYYPSASGDRTASFTLGSGTRAYGGFAGTEVALNERDYAANATVLSGDLASAGGTLPSYHVVKHVNVDDTAVLDGFTITGGRADGSGDNANGGGIFHDGSQVVLRHLIVSSNTAGGLGGGFYSRGETASSFASCQFLSNTANEGGAVYSLGAIDLDRAQFRGNQAATSGGAITLARPSVTSDYANAVISNSVFVGNRLTANGRGGALFAQRWNLRLLNATVYNNRVPDGTFTPSAVYAEDVSVDVENSILSGNRDAASADSSSLGRSQFFAPYEIARDAVTLHNNLIEGFDLVTPSGGVRGAPLATGNFDADPRFVDASSGNVHLLANSPVIDRGTGTPDADRAGDADGFPRLVGSAVDLGAYEFQGSAQSTTGLIARTRTAGDEGLTYTFQFLPANALGGTITYTWTVNRNDGRGFVALPVDSRVTGATTDQLVIALPPTAWSGWQFRVEASGVRTSTATTALPTTTGKERLYVNANATGTGDGSSWANAFPRLEDAIAASGNDYSQIWVAQGTYRPSPYKNSSAAFVLRPGLVLYGGFAGTETTLAQRNPALYPTILSGDYASFGDSYLNARNVIAYQWANSASIYDLTLPGTLDGFSLNTAWEALISVGDGATPTISHCILENSAGAGVMVSDGAPVFSADIFRNILQRAARVSGGTPTFTLCQFTRNEGGEGAAMLVDHGAVTVTKCTIADNYALGATGGISVWGGSVAISASILWNNRDFASDNGGPIEAAQLAKTGGTLTIANSLVEKLSAFAGNGNLDTHPLFADPGNLNYTLLAQSPANPLGAGALPFAGAALTPLGITDLPISRTEVTTLFSATFTIGWNATFTQTVSWQVDRGQGWVPVVGSGFTPTVSSDASGSTLVLTNGTNPLPTLRVRAVTSGGVALPVTQLTIIPPVIRYVKSGATGTGDGQSWTNAYTDVRAAVQASLPGTEIWIARGTYEIASGLELRPGVALVGGFAGSETSRGARVLSPSTRTQLNTVLLATSRPTVVYQDGNTYTGLFGRQLVLDGLTLAPRTGGTTPPLLTIQGGAGIYRNVTFTNIGDTTLSVIKGGTGVSVVNGSPFFDTCAFVDNPDSGVQLTFGGSPRFVSCTFSGNSNSGLRIDAGGAFLDRCTFLNNRGASDGGGIRFNGSTLTIANSLFFKNRARNGAAVSVDGRLVARNVTVADNTANAYGGGFYTYSGALDVANAIFWGNTGSSSAPAGFGGTLTEAGQLYSPQGTIAVVNSIVQGLSLYAGHNNLPYDPLFSGDLLSPYALSASSPAISQGNLALLDAVAPVATFSGRLRDTLDLGAFEFSGTASAPLNLLLAPRPVTTYNGASVTFNVVGDTGVGPDVLWWRLVNGTAVQLSGPSSPTSAALNLTNVDATQAGYYYFTLTSKGYTSPSYLLTVNTRPAVYVDAAVSASGNGSAWATAFKTIEEAVASAGADREVRIAKGDYTVFGTQKLKPGFLFLGGYAPGGSTSRDPASNPVRITVAGSFLADPQYQSSYDGSLAPIDSTAGFNGVTLTLPASGSLTFRNGATPAFNNCTVTVLAESGLDISFGAAPEFVGCTFTGSTQQIFHVYQDGALHLSGGAFTANQATAILAETGGSVVIDQVTFDGNTLVTGTGRLLDLEGSGASSIVRSRFTKNGLGSALPQRLLVGNLGATLTLTDSLFDRNAAAPIYAGGTTLARHLTVANNVFPSGFSGALVTGSLDVRNSIFWNNRYLGASPFAALEPQQVQILPGGSGHLAVSSSIIEGLAFLAGNGNFGWNPLFADATGETYVPSAFSPAVNSAATADQTAVDLAGVTRGTTPDRGAFECLDSAVTPLALFNVPYTPVTAKNYYGNTATLTVTGGVGFGGNVHWWRWDGTQLLALPADGRFSVTSTSTGSTLTVKQIGATDNGAFRFTVDGTTYQSASLLLNPTVRLRIYVDPASTAANGGDGLTWATAYRNLVSAYQLAPVGSDIWVAQGSYSSFTLAPRSGVALYGGFTPGATAFSQRSTDASLTVLRGSLDNGTTFCDETAIVDGVTFSGGSPAVTNRGDSTPVFNHCLFRDNYTAFANYAGRPTLTACVFRDNQVALSISDGVLTVNDSEFTSGANAIETLAPGALALNRASAHDLSGGFYFLHGDGQTTVDRSEFQRISAAQVLAVGGNTPGVGTLTLRNSLVHDNAASDAAVCSAVRGNVAVVHCTFYNNTGGWETGGIETGGGGSATVQNSILWRNRGTRNAGTIESQQAGISSAPATLTVSSNIVEGLATLPGAGNLGGDPLFADIYTNNFALTAASPAVNAGADLANEDQDHDFSGNARVFGAKPDLGAYEFAATSSTALNVVRSPVSTTVMVNGTAQFVVEAASGGGGQFGWEIETAPNVFSALPADGTYTVTTSGNTSTLTIGPITGAFSTHRYRFRIGAVASAPFTLTKIAVLYVNARATGTPDGTTWDRGYRSISDAVAHWTAGLEIWVAAASGQISSFYPMGASVQLQPGMKIYGGFYGFETSSADRVPNTSTGVVALGSFTQFFNAPAGVGRDTVVDGFSFVNPGDNRAFTITDSSPTIANCWFAGFSATDTIRTTNAAALLQNCRFYDSTGGAIAEINSASEIVNCQFNHCSRSGTGNVGSAILIDGHGASGSTTVRFGVFSANIGGAVRILNGASPLLDRGYFIQNTGTESAALYAAAGTAVELRNTLVAQNTTSATRGVVTSDGALTLRNVTLADNTLALWSGHVGALESGGTLAIYNSILWGNRAAGADATVTAEQHQLYAHGTAPVVDHSLLEGLAVYAGSGNLGFNPFFDARGAHAYELTRSSPAVNAGANANAVLDGADLNGASRLVGTTVDLGAFELADVTGAVALALTDNPADQSTHDVTVWSTGASTLAIAGDAATVAKIYWETYVDGAWIALPAGGDLSSSATSSAAVLTIGAATSDTFTDRLVRFRVTGSDYISSVYTLTARTRVFYVRNNYATPGDGTSWSKAFNSLATALATVPSHVEIWVQAGSYNVTGLTFPAALRVYGGFAGTETDRSARSTDASKTVLNGSVALSGTDGTNLWNGLAFRTGGAGLALTHSGGTFQNCRFTNGGAATGVTVRNSSESVTFEDCVFTASDVRPLDHTGGALTLRRCTFQNTPGSNAAGTILITDSTFDNAGGLALSASGTAITVQRTVFSNALVSDGAPFYVTSPTGTVTLTDCTFLNNFARGAGHGVLHADTVQQLNLDRCIFRGNHAQYDAAALQSGASRVSVRNSYFAENLDEGSNAAGVIHLTDCVSSLVGVSVIRNTAQGARAGLTFDGATSANDTATIVNAVLWGNRGGSTSITTEAHQLLATNTAVTMTYSLVEGLDGYAAGAGMIGYAPRDPVLAATSLYTPGTDSPARNAGNNAVVLAGEKDVNGNARLFGAAVDLGAIENSGPDATPVLDLMRSALAPGAYLEVTYDTGGRDLGDLGWQINTGSGWVSIPGAQVVSTTASGNLRTLRLAWQLGLQGAKVRLQSAFYNSSSLTLDFGPTVATSGSVLAVTPAPDSRATSARPTIAVSLSQAFANGTFTDAQLVVHGGQRGRLTSSAGRWGTLATASPLQVTLTPSLSFAAGETVEVTASRSLATALGGTFTPYVSRFAIPWTSRDGAFRRGESLAPLSGTVTGVAAGDLNGDGLTDLLFAGSDNAWLYLADGLGGFTQVSLNGLQGWTAFAVADFNGDGRVDFAGSRNGTSLSFSTVTTATDGSAVVSPLFSSLAVAGTRLLPGDFDGDGRQDLLVLGPTNGADGELLLRNTGSGFAPVGSQRFNVTEPTREAAVADLDHDGDLDFVQVGANTGDIVVWLNNGSGQFTTGGTIRVPNTQTIALADIDGDGWTDLIVAGGSGGDTLQIHRNDHTGHFVLFRSLAAGAIVQLAAADFDGDGDTDLVAISGTAADEFWRNDGVGNFTRTNLAWTSTGAGATAQLAVADLNNDGAADIALPQDARPVYWMPGIWLQDFAVTLAEGSVKTFAASDFTSRTTTNGYTLTGYRVTALPTKGVLKLNGVAVTLNQDLSPADLDQLAFASIHNIYGADSFTLAPRDAAGLSPSSRVRLTITRVVDPPVATGQAVDAFAQVPKAITLLGTHPENEAMTFTVGAAAHGTVSNTGTAAVYTANANFSGADSFPFTVADAFGGSSTATVTINVTNNVRTVTTAADTGAGSLREQVAYALAQGGAWRITFASALAGQVIDLATADDTTLGATAFAVIPNHVTIEIDASDASGLVLRRASATDPLRFFRLTAGGQLTLKNLTLRAGLARGTPARGGAIYNDQGTVELTNVHLESNQAISDGGGTAEGGAIYANLGTLTATDATFLGNEARNGTGGALQLVGGTATVTRPAFTTNVAPTSGADVQLVANASAPSTTRWVSAELASTLALANTGGAVQITANGGHLPSSLPAWVSTLSVPTITGNTSVSFSSIGTVRSVTKANGQNVLGVALDGSLTSLNFVPAGGTSGTETYVLSYAASGVTYREEFDVTYNVPLGAPPVLHDQTVTVHNNQPLTFTLDASISAGLTGTYNLVVPPTKGDLTPAGGAITGPITLTYTPHGLLGTDDFTYHIVDSQSHNASAHVTINLQQDGFVVSSAAELNDALTAAQAMPGNVTITLTSALAHQTIPITAFTDAELGGACVDVASGTFLTINGTPAPGAVLQRAGAAHRMFLVHEGATLTLNHVTLAGGDTSAPGSGGLGGLIYNERATVSASFVTFQDGVARGAAPSGGAIYNLGGTVTIADSIFDNDVVVADDGQSGVGCVLASNGGVVTLTRTSIVYDTKPAYSDVSFFAGSGASTLTLDQTPVTRLNAASIAGSHLDVYAGTSAVGGDNNTPSIAALSEFTVRGLATIPLPTDYRPLNVSATSLNPDILPNAWLSTISGFSPTLKITPVSPTLGATATVRVAADARDVTFYRDIPIKFAAPVAPVAVSKTITVPALTNTPITLDATYPAGLTPTFTIVTPPAQGRLTGQAPNLTYVPDSSGSYAFTFRITDDDGLSSDGTVTLSVVADGTPYFFGDMAFAVATGSDFPNFLSAGHTADDAYLAVHPFRPPTHILEAAHFTYSIVGTPRGTATLTPTILSDGSVAVNTDYIAPNTGGRDDVVIRVTDQYGRSATMTTTYYVMDPALNTPPVIANLNPTLAATPNNAVALFANATAVDPDAPPQTLFVAIQQPDPEKGELLGLDGWFPYADDYDVNGDPINPQYAAYGTPADITQLLRNLQYQHTHAVDAGTAENVSLAVIIEDDFTFEDPTRYTLNVRVTPAAETPVANALDLTTTRNTPVAATLSASHPQSLALTYTLPVAPQKGALSGTAPNLTYTPNPDAFGDDGFVYRVTDPNGNFATAPVTLFINRAPVIADHTLTRFKEDNATVTTAALLADVTDADGDAVTFVSVNATSALGATVAESGGTITYTAASPAAITAEDYFTYTVHDARGATATGKVFVELNIPNQTPTLDAIANPAAILEDAGAQTVSLTGIGPGSGESIQAVTLTATSSNLALIPNPTVTYTNPNTTGTLSFTPAANASGSAVITVTVKDDGGTAHLSVDTLVRTFTVNVTAVNDAPTLDAIANPTAIAENAGAQTVNLTGIGIGAGESNQTLTVTATSSNLALIPNPTVTYTSPNATGALNYTPVAHANGSAVITVTVKDDGGTANGSVDTVTRTFTVNVTAINHTPTLDAISDPAAILEDAGAQTVNLAGLGAGAGESGQTLTVTASSSNPALIPDPTVTYTSPNATGSLSYTPVANANGTAVITVTVKDNGGTANGGVDTLTRTFTVNVTAVNDAPTLDAISDPAPILEDAGAQTVNLTGIGIGAGETSQTLTVTATSSNPALVPDPTVTYASSNATGSLSYTPVANANGTAVITVTVKDNGGTANGGVDTLTRTFTVTVTAVNDAPTLDAIPNPAAILEDAGAQTVNLTGIGAGSGESAQTLTVTATSSDPTLIPDPTVTYTSPNATGSLSYTPVANANGTAVITVTVKDNGGTTHGGVDTVTRTFTVTVTAVNDAPTLTAISNPAAIDQDSGAQTINLTGITAGGGETGQALTLAATSNNTALIPNPSVTYTSPNATGSLTYTPVGGATGTAVVTVAVHDDGGTANGGADTITRTFTVTVSTAADVPAILTITARSGGGVTLHVAGAPNASYTISVSTDLATWSALGTATTDGSGAATYDDSTSPNVGAARFYRATRN